MTSEWARVNLIAALHSHPRENEHAPLHQTVVRCLVVALLAVLGTAVTASTSYAQLTQNDPTWQKDQDYFVKTTGTVTAPVMSVYTLEHKIELKLPDGTYQLTRQKTISGGGNGAAQNYDSGWLSVLTYPNNPPAGGNEYRVTVSGYYTLMGVKTDFTAVQKTVIVYPAP